MTYTSPVKWQFSCCACFMLMNYFKTALRTLQRNKAYTLVNILGLTLGLACAILIFSLVKFHLSFDNFHEGKERIYRVLTAVQGGQMTWQPGVPPPLAEAMRNDYAFIEEAGRVATFKDQLVSVPQEVSVKKFQEEAGFSFADPSFFRIMHYPLAKGSLMAKPNTAVITERIAEKYFGNTNAIGRSIRVINRFNNNKLEFRVTGILQNLPANTDRRQEVYLSYQNLHDFHRGFAEDNWYQTSAIHQSYFRLKPGATAAEAANVLPAFSDKHYNPQQENRFRFSLQPLSDIHFNTGIDGKVDRQHLWALSLTGLFLVITACVNFINLATAQALSRSKEIGIRKVLGSLRLQLFRQFITETAIIATTAMVLAFVLSISILPYVNQLFGTQLSIHLFSDVQLMLFLPVLLLAVIFFAGSYPGLILAGFQPVAALKGKLSHRHAGGLNVRKGLVVTQFAISQLLIIGTLVIANQMRYAKQADLGFRKDAMVMLPVPVRDQASTGTLNALLAAAPGVEGLTFCGEEPAGHETYITNIRYAGREKSEDFSIYLKGADARYVPVFGLQLAAGRNLSPIDTSKEYLVNETTVKKLGLSSPEQAINQPVRIDGSQGLIVGVVKDFHNRSFHEPIIPICLTSGTGWYGRCAVKVDASRLSAAMPAIEAAWNKTFPDHLYKYDFLDEKIARFYQLDDMLLRLIQFFAAVAILIGCMGLYGLMSFMAAQKTKEVGVRKVLGASVQNILWLFGKEFGKLLLIAFVIAAPVAWYVMTDWLQNFAYRIRIGVGIFALAILVTVVVAVVSIGYRSVQAALMNPMRSLRSE
ncbi:ABC transporter permease [Chitinophaga sp. GCM10012297]|uniref:ABC transporter permease n=1 Tax=Chitinophaga chungangae TaxID=2821488 RepID=A0ABS3Y9B8_9BACT|nr:ABC transporter permease [Chitinophaga chungangae]MBO9151265.1 ABC transporter permease [Chitinophaga chungangae]